MANTISKSEILSNARTMAIDLLKINDVFGVAQIGPSEYAFPTITTPDGAPVYVKVKITAANFKGTEKVPAFDITTAADNYKLEVAEKAKAAEEKSLKKKNKN